MLSTRTPDDLMLVAALTNNWDKAVEVISTAGNAVAAANLGAASYGREPLHGASTMGHTDFVRKLCSMFPDNEIAARDSRGLTALHAAALSGNIEVASYLLARNRDLSGAVADNGDTPICVAARCRKTLMFEFLLEMVRPGPDGDLRAEDWFRLLLIILGQDMFQTALVILDINGSVTTATVLHLFDSKLGTMLHVLAAKPAGKKRLNELVDRVWSVMREFEPDDLYRLLCGPENRPVILEAAKVGNLAFIQKLFKENRNYIWAVNEKGHTLFHVALLHGWCKILRWLDEIDDEKSSMKAHLAQMQDANGNCLLHLAAKVAAAAPKATVTSRYGQLIRLRQDFNFFEDVKKMAPDLCVHLKNNAGLEPWELFEQGHAAMAEASKKLMQLNHSTFIICFNALIGPLVKDDHISRSFKGFVVGNFMAAIIIFCWLVAGKFSLRQRCKFVPRAELIGCMLYGIGLLGYSMGKITMFTAERVWTWPSVALEASKCFIVLANMFVLCIFWWYIVRLRNVLWRRKLYE